MNFSKRLEKLRNLMDNKYNKFLITDPNDVYYYTGFRTDFGFLVVGKNSVKLFLSPLDNEGKELKIETIFVKQFKDILKELGKPKTMGYDEHHLNAYFFSKLKKLNMKPASDIIKKPREVKESWEIEQIREAIKINKKVFSELDMYGKSEIIVKKQIEYGFLKHDAETAFPTIVSSGKNSYFIHHNPTEKTVKKTETIIIDFGSKVNGYCSDVTRTFCGNKKEKETFEIVKNMQKIIIDEIKEGTDFNDLHKKYEQLMTKHRYKVWHRIGHGIGLSAHENITGKLEKNMIITVEPGVYIKNKFGCRIEDCILIKKSGAEILSDSIPK